MLLGDSAQAVRESVDLRLHQLPSPGGRACSCAVSSVGLLMRNQMLADCDTLESERFVCNTVYESLRHFGM
eukprot:8707443-Alexandrium_andersonii.AAC.1